MNTESKKQNASTTPEPMMTIKDILTKSGLSGIYVRKAISNGDLPSVLVQVGATKVYRREIKAADFETWRATRKNSRREDGRGRSILYATPEELTKIKSLLASNNVEALVEKPKPQVHKPKVEAPKA